MENITWKTRLQSQTLRGALVAAIVGLVRIIAVIFGFELDFGAIEFWLAVGVYVLAEGFNLGLLRMIWKGRVKANTRINTETPWLDEIKTLMKGK